LTNWQGYLIFGEKLEQKTSGTKRLCIQVSHVPLDVLNAREIAESEHKGIEDRKSMRGFANLTRILSKRDIAPPVESVFDGPVIANEFQEAAGASLFGGEAGNAIDIFLRAFEGRADPSAQTQDLSNLVAIAGQKVIELGGDLDEASRRVVSGEW